jgi:hypothetical protein
MPDQTIDAIKVKLGVDASDVAKGVADANKELNALNKQRRSVFVDVEPTLTPGKTGTTSRYFQRLKEGVKVPLEVDIKSTGQFSITEVRKKIQQGLKAGGGVNVPVRIELSAADASVLRANIRKSVGIVNIDFDWVAKSAPKYSGVVLVNWNWGKGPSGPPPWGGGPGTPAAGGSSGGAASPSAGAPPTAPSGGAHFRPGRQPGETAQQASARHKAEHEADIAAEKAAREEKKAAEGKQKQAKKEQDAQRTAQSTGASSTTPGTVGDATRRAQRDAERSEQQAARARKDAADRTVRTSRQQALDTEAGELRKRRKDIETAKPSKTRDNKLAHQKELEDDLNARRREAAKEARAQRPAPTPGTPASIPAPGPVGGTGRHTRADRKSVV